MFSFFAKFAEVIEIKVLTVYKSRKKNDKKCIANRKGCLSA